MTPQDKQQTPAERDVPEPEAQQGHGRSPAKDERLKRLLKQHPRRDEPKIDSVEPDETPPPP